MELLKVLEKPLAVKGDDPLMHAIQLMCNENRHEVYVFNNDKFVGVVTARDIIKKNFSSLEEIRVETLLRKIAPLAIDTEFEDIAKHLIISEFRSIPIEHEGKIYALSKLSLLKIMDKSFADKKKIKDVMNFPYVIESNDSIAVARSMMRDLNISRLPVIEDGKVAGILDILDVLRAVGERHRVKLGEVRGEKIDLGSVEVSSFMQKNFVTVSQDTSLIDAINEMIKSNVHAVLVVDEDKLSGMVTIKDIFKIFGRSVGSTYINVSGLDVVDEFERSWIEKRIESMLEKIGKQTNVRYIFTHIDKHKKEGKRAKYSVKGRLVSDAGTFYASYYDWDLLRAMKVFLDKMEKEVIKSIEKVRDTHRKRLIGV